MNGENEDIILVRKFKNREEGAFDKIFEKYKVPLYSICYRYTRNDADAHDLCQEVFIKVYRGLNGFNEKSKFFTWFYRIAVNTCISFKRHQRVSNPILYELPAKSLPLDERISMKVAIDDALIRLPERQRLSFILRHYEGYTFQEIGEIMGISLGAAKANHFHAVKKLQVMLKELL
jgi:RNA polymerase sigma-70 factor (ECF subfamily)